MRLLVLPLALALIAAPLAHARKHLIGDLKTIPLDDRGEIPGHVASPNMGQGSYLKGVNKVIVPLVAVAFESSAQASVTKKTRDSLKSSHLESHLLIDEKVLQQIADQMQAIVERELTANGFEVLPHDTVDTDARYAGITKDAPTGVEVKDNFMSGFAGNGTKNRWFTAGQRALFGAGATAALSETSPLIHIARERGEALVFVRFKVQYADLEASNSFFGAHVKGKNVLHINSADLTVFSPAKTNGGMLKLKADVTAGADYVQESRELAKNPSDETGLQMSALLDSLLSGSATTATSGKHSGHYAVIANPEVYQRDSLALLTAVTRQFAQALRDAQ
ncbi:hypothetical protein K0B96_00395 [Horticoccus luteus]|uniref:Uncharacterized protein n=1 Tax=Horticoccus luteus TaxID=2862869 RepID=A0A8F9TVK9_9BACT|nr:hypothetical protein [Horticoccus luteus]QYM79108.1 hypothetical protein K0B96_00395 [Horticoccus luteus]